MRILVADDDAATRLALQATLRGTGHEVVAVADGESAWDLLQERDAPKLAVLDWTMPALDGLEVIRRARAAFPGDPVYSIVLTSHDSKEHLVRALEAGADDYMVKPANPRELRARIQVGVRVVQLQAMLLKEQHHLHSLMDNLPVAIYFKDRHSRFTLINKVQARHLGLAGPGQAIGKTDYDFFCAEHAAQALEDERQIIRTGQPLVEMEEKENWPNGTATWVASTKMPLRGRGGEITGTFGVSRDITKRKHAENELHQSQHMLRLILDSIPQRVFWKDRNSTFLGCNRAFAMDAGLRDPAEVVGKNDFELAWRESAEPHRADDRLVMDRESPKLSFEERRTTQDGRLLWLHVNKLPLRSPEGEVIGVLGTYEDVTERKQAEEALRVSESRYRRLFEHNLAGVGRITPEGRILDCNESLARMLGYGSAQELCSHNAKELWYNAGGREGILDSVRESQGVSNYEFRFRRKDGRPAWVIANITPVEEEAGRCMEATLVDITDRKRAEEALAEEASLAALRAEIGAVLVRAGTLRSGLQECAEALVQRTGVAFARNWVSP